MNALLNISWFLGFVFSIILVFHYIGFSGLTSMFPEGKRAWHLPAQLLTLVFFGAMVLYNPFITWSVK
jgi:TRAP-type C4-dicarboxylate transport system permease small subunit